MYFSYCPDGGFETHRTELQAKTSAEESLSYFRENACDGWSEEVDGICWGKISQDTHIVSSMTIKEAEAEGIIVSSDCSRVVDYGLVKVGKFKQEERMKVTPEETLLILRAMNHYEGSEESSMHEDMQLRHLEDKLEDYFKYLQES